MTLKIEDVKRVTRELLDEYGEDYRYRPGADSAGCTYGPQQDGPDGCLIGLIAKRLDPEMYARLVETDKGLTLFDLHPWYDPEVTGGGNISYQNEAEVCGTGIIQTETTELALAMRRAQADQDRREPWGVAAGHILNL